MKQDAQKLRYDLIPPETLAELAGVLTHGAGKYADNNWKTIENFQARYYAALERHLQAWRCGEARDADSGELHLSHALCCLTFLVWDARRPALPDADMREL